MDINSLTEQLSEFGTVQAIKADAVFTLFMTGYGFENWGKAIQIQTCILKAAAKFYPNIEIIKTEPEFYLIVMK